MSEDMVILTRMFDLLRWLVPQAERFPRNFRHTVTQRLLDSALDLQDLLCEAQTSSGTRRRDLLARCDAALNRLRLYLRLAHQWQWLNNGQYEHVSRMVAEVGRLLGGWIKATQRGGRPIAR